MSDPSEPTQPAGDRTSDAAADAAPDPAADNASDTPDEAAAVTPDEAAAVATDDAAAGSVSDKACRSAATHGRPRPHRRGDLMLFAFLTPQYNSGAENLPQHLGRRGCLADHRMLDQQQPGHSFTTVEDEAAAGRRGRP